MFVWNYISPSLKSDDSRWVLYLASLWQLTAEFLLCSVLENFFFALTFLLQNSIDLQWLLNPFVFCFLFYCSYYLIWIFSFENNFFMFCSGIFEKKKLKYELFLCARLVLKQENLFTHKFPSLPTHSWTRLLTLSRTRTSVIALRCFFFREAREQFGLEICVTLVYLFLCISKVVCLVNGHQWNRRTIKSLFLCS